MKALLNLSLLIALSIFGFTARAQDDNDPAAVCKDHEDLDDSFTSFLNPHAGRTESSELALEDGISPSRL